MSACFLILFTLERKEGREAGREERRDEGRRREEKRREGTKGKGGSRLSREDVNIKCLHWPQFPHPERIWMN